MTKMIEVANPTSHLFDNMFYQAMKVGDCRKIVVSGQFADNRYNYITKENFEVFVIKGRDHTRVFTKLPEEQVREAGLMIESCQGLWNCLRQSAKENIVFICPSIRSITKLSYCENKENLDDIFDTKKFPTKRQGKNELGTELELEGTNHNWPDKFMPKMNLKSLVAEVGRDGSVARNGTEIRFNHPELSGWNMSAIRSIMKLAKESGFSAGPSAGQHVHISHPDILKAIYKFEFNLDLMNEFFKPISCRQTDRYGLNKDLYRNQHSSFGTLEIRAWESTTDPVLFRKRIVFSKMFVDYLVGDEPIEDIWTKMPLKMAKLYVDMLFTDNPHLFGGDPKDVLKKLSGWARNYAKRTYNQGE